MNAIQQLDRTILLCRDYVAQTLTNEQICDCFQSVRILLVSDLRNASSHSGQTALITLVSLLSRMGMQVELAIPEIKLVSEQPPFSGECLREALLASSERLIAGASVLTSLGAKADLVFVLGDTEFQPTNDLTWRLGGGPWDGALAPNRNRCTTTWTEWPIGALSSAALAACEAFKFAIRRLPLRNPAARIFLEPCSSCGFDFGSAPLPPRDLDLGNVDIISAGAVSQACLFALMRLPNVHLRGRIFDDDATDESNFNRNPLTLITDVQIKKVVVAAHRCRSKLQLESISERFTDEVAGTTGLAPRVLVGVDHIPTRWLVQRCEPDWLSVGATSHFNILVSSHARCDPCSGCLHPYDEDGGGNLLPSVSFVSFWAGLAMAVRLVREALGYPYQQHQQQLWMAPLRMDQPRATIWSPVAVRKDCPVPCRRSQAALTMADGEGRTSCFM